MSSTVRSFALLLFALTCSLTSLFAVAVEVCQAQPLLTLSSGFAMPGQRKLPVGVALHRCLLASFCGPLHPRVPATNTIRTRP